MRKTTTWNLLSGDFVPGKLRPLYAPIYALVNGLHNSHPYEQLDDRLEVRDFACDLEKYGSQFTADTTPSRLLCNLFWHELPWAKIKQELGEIRVLDSGCGAGNYGATLMEWSGNTISSYTGLDLFPRENWHALEAANPTFKFQQCEDKDTYKHIPPSANFLMSQSAIEHFRYDLEFFGQIRDHVNGYGRPAVQVHLFPSSACLRLYGPHGFRHYTPRTVSMITRLFDERSHCVLYGLGGRECNALHYEFITSHSSVWRPGDLRDQKPDDYVKRLRSAVEADFKDPGRDPAFWALVIQTNPTTRLFVSG